MRDYRPADYCTASSTGLSARFRNRPGGKSFLMDYRTNIANGLSTAFEDWTLCPSQ